MSKQMHQKREQSKFSVSQIIRSDNTDVVSVDIVVRTQVGMQLSSEIVLAVLRKRTRKILKLPNP